MKVCKFGGSSVAGSAQFKKVKDIVGRDDRRQVVIISAAGKRDPEDHKLTDLLYLCHAHLTYGVSAREIIEEITRRFREIVGELRLSEAILDEIEDFGNRLGKDTHQEWLVSRGEYFTARLMAEYLGYAFVDAADCVFFDFDGTLDREKTYAAIGQAYKDFGRIVIPGFYGSLPGGRIHVMPRGGSDITGALAAAALDADVYENWTDVNGVLMADPRIVKDPAPIARMTYGELRELAFLGASVLQEDSVMPVREKGIPLNIRNTNMPDDPGTLIMEKVEEEPSDTERFITGIAGRRGFTLINIKKHNMNVIEMLRAALKVMQKYGAGVEHITLGLDSFSLITSGARLGESLYPAISDIKKACEPEDIAITENLSLVAAVGRKMTFRPGISGRLFGALGDNAINIRTITQGADELSIVVGVDDQNYENCVRVLYDSFAG